MPVAAAVSVASFSVVLAETFAAVGLSSIIPAGVVTLARAVKAGTAAADEIFKELAGEDATQGSAETPATPAKPGLPAAAGIAKLVKAMGASTSSLDLLLPQKAHIHAEFTFEGRESESANVSGNAGGMIELVVVGVSAGYSALYEEKSTNKISMDIDFVSVNVPI